MAWDHLSITKPHLVYIILGGFTSLFMLCSSLIKERLYIGEATVATICGIIFGPHAANLINPLTWGNTDLITLEFSRIVLVVQCFAVGVELPRYYMERHWRSVVYLLIPVMTWGWLITSVCIYWMIPRLNWLESLCVAACVTATDPVLASSVVGKGKFAKRIPKHLRDILSAESGCNDGMAFPFVYLAIYCIQEHLNARDVTYHWFVYTLLYECLFGAIYGFIIGYAGRQGIKYAEKHDLVDRESFLVFYFVLALFCAGSGSILGVDDLLVAFAAGVGFSNDGWFTQKTEESHVSNVIDLLINLAYFVYLGTIIPWAQFNDPEIGTAPWRLVVIAFCVLFFRRIPIMLALKPLIPDIKTWREACFAGHFGPIGVGAIFIAILARAELETGSTTPLASYPESGAPNATLVALIWPITTFLVITSIIVHGSSIAVFTLGKHINTLTITMSYTQAGEEGPGWMNRLPRIQSTSRSMARTQDSEGEKMEYPPGTLPPIGHPGSFLRRQREEEDPTKSTSRTSSIRPSRKKKQWNDGIGPGGPITQSAIYPQRRHGSAPLGELPPELQQFDPRRTPHAEDNKEKSSTSDDSTKNEGTSSGEDMVDLDITESPQDIDNSNEPPPAGYGSAAERHPLERHIYDEHENIIIENADGDVLATQPTPNRQAAEEDVTKEIIKNQLAQGKLNHFKKFIGSWRAPGSTDGTEKPEGSKKKDVRRTGPALAYQFGNTIIVEDADGEVVKTWEVPSSKEAGHSGQEQPDSTSSGRLGLSHLMSRSKVPKVSASAPSTMASGSSDPPQASPASRPVRPSAMSRVGTEFLRRGAGFGFGAKDELKESSKEDEEDDRHIRVTIGPNGQRLTKEDFIKQIQGLDPKTRAEVVERSDIDEEIKVMARNDAKNTPDSYRPKSSALDKLVTKPEMPKAKPAAETPAAERGGHDGDTAKPSSPSYFDGIWSAGASPSSRKPSVVLEEGSNEPETMAERRRREAALGKSNTADEDSDDDDTVRVPPTIHKAAAGTGSGDATKATEIVTKQDQPSPPRASRVNTAATQNAGQGHTTTRGIRFANTP